MNKREVGTRKERLAGKLLELEGYEIVDYNYRCRRGEIDIIARHMGYLVFVEVKYRQNEDKGEPQEAVDTRKQQKLMLAARHYYAQMHLPYDTPCRFDVVAIRGEKYKIIPNAFGVN